MDQGSGVRVKIRTLNNGQWSGKPDPRSIVRWEAIRCTQTGAKGLWTWDQVWEEFDQLVMARGGRSTADPWSS